MKKTTACAIALLLSACHEEPAMTFGLHLRVLEGAEEATSSCLPHGAHGGESSSMGAWTTGEPPPHLFVDAEPDAEENTYRVRVYVASERDDDGIWWIPSEVLAERTYDGVFGESGAQDSIEVDFNGQPYTIEVLGLPPGAPCP